MTDSDPLPTVRRLSNVSVLGLRSADAVVVAAVGLILVVRAGIAGLSGFGSFHGLNEAVYSLQAMGFLEDPLRSRVAGLPYHDTPPLAGWSIAATFAVLGNSEFAARLPSLLAEAVAIGGVWMLGSRMYDRATGRRAALIFAVLPWNLLWFGRAMADPYLVALLAVGFAFLAAKEPRSRDLVLGGLFLGLAFLAKQTALIAFPIAAWQLRSRPFADWLRFAAGAAVGCLPIAAWYAWSWAIDPEALRQSAELHLRERSPPFANVPRNVAFGLLLGATPPVLGLAAWQAWREKPRWPNLCTAWFLVFVAFFMLKAPIHHEYYLLALMPPLAVLAAAALPDAAASLRARGLPDANAATGMLVTVGVGVLGGFLLLGIAGDLGSTAVREMAGDTQAYLEANPDALVSVPWGHEMKFSYYLERAQPGLADRVTEDRSPSVHAEATRLITRSPDAPAECQDCRLVAVTSYGFGPRNDTYWTFERPQAPPAG